MVTSRDCLLTRTLSAQVHHDQQMALFYLGTLPEAVVWSSSDTAVATVDAGGFVTHLATGTVTITAAVGAHSMAQTLLLTVDAVTVDTLADYAPGSLAKHVSDAVDSRLAGKSASTALALFSAQDHVTPAFTRNPSAWPADLGAALASISPSNSSAANLWAGVAISPLHVLFAAHAAPGIGCEMRFVTADNQLVTRTLQSALNHPDYVPYYPDLRVGVLDRPLPETIPPAKILPQNWASYLPSLSDRNTVPALCLDQEEKALVTDLATLDSFATFAFPNQVNWGKRAEFYEEKVGGDSGNPAFLIINGELVLLTVWTSGGAGDGTSVVTHAAALNALMTSLGGGYQLTPADLSGFTTY